MLLFFLGILVALVGVSLASPTPRRLWVLYLLIFKYVVLALLDVLQVRRLRAWFSGQNYQRMTLPRAARLLCEDLGPTFIKFGQVVASSVGVFPRRYVEEFQHCLDNVKPLDFDEVREILIAELGSQRTAEFVELSARPLASASIAQVHAARLPNGDDVVIKVQRPNIAHRVEADVRIMKTMARVLVRVSGRARIANPMAIVEDFHSTIAEELDFRQEAANLGRFNDIMLELGHADVRAPAAHLELTTHRVLVMERLHGVRIDAVAAIRAQDINAEDQLIKAMRAWFQCVLFHGFFHGDVHAGNLMLLQDGSIGVLDFGIVGRFDDSTRRRVSDYLIAMATSDYDRMAAAIVGMGVAPQGLNANEFASDLRDVFAAIRTKSFADINYVELLPDVQRVAEKHHMVLPRQFVLITKQLLYFDRYAKLLAPNLNVFTDPRLLAGLLADLHRAASESV